jgi:hypothetical protein
MHVATFEAKNNCFTRLAPNTELKNYSVTDWGQFIATRYNGENREIN